jgi:hypothetical protein
MAHTIQALARLRSISEIEPYVQPKTGPRFQIASHEDVTYEVYCSVLDNMSRPDNQQIAFDFSLPVGLLKAFGDLKAHLTEIANEFKVGFAEVIKAFKQKDVFALLKGLGFNIKGLWKAIHTFTALVPKGLFKIFDSLIKSGAIDKLKAGTIKIDDLLHAHPLLTRLGGLAIAGLLVWIWLSMSFTGNPQFDLNLGTIIDAFHGNFNLTDLFLSPDGLTMLTLLGTGMFTSIGVAWLGANLANLLLAFIFTGAHKLHDSGLVAKMTKVIQHKKY